MKHSSHTNIGIALFVLLFFYLFVLQIQAIWPFTIDDMYISLRYAKNWAGGHGLLWNVGEPPVEGYSNFSFVYLGRLAIELGFDPVVVLKAAGVFGLLWLSFAVYGIARTWFTTQIALIPCLWLLAYKGQILWSVSGLETTVYQALICSAVFFIFVGLENDARGPISFVMAGILLALAGMTRPEAPALMILFFILLLFNRPTPAYRHYWYNLALFSSTIIICFAPYFLWRWHYYGRLFPNPVYCKGLTNSFYFMLDKHYLRLIWPFALLALPAIFRGSDRRHYFLWLPSIVYLLLLLRADPIVAFDNRLFLPVWALMLPLSLKGMDCLLNRYMKGSSVITETMYFGAFLVAFFFIPMMSLKGYRHFTEHPLAGEQLREKVVSWLNTHQVQDTHVVLADSGLIPYRSGYQFIDSYCLNNRDMTNSLGISMYQRFCESVLKTKPEVIILSSLTENGKTTYTPADACLAKRLATDGQYCLQMSLKTGSSNSFYRYEIFSKSKGSCSKMLKNE